MTILQVRLQDATITVTDPLYGAAGDGVTDDTAAFQAAITDAMGSVRFGRILVPAGTYKVRFDSLTGLRNLIFVGDPWRTTITGGTHTVLNYSNPSLSGTCSQLAFSFTSCTNITFQDIIFDGQQPLGPTYYPANYTDVQAMLEFRSCTGIQMHRCTFINFTPAAAIASSGGNPNPDPIEGQNLGPLFLNGCDVVTLLDTRLLTPCYGEGFTLMNCTHVFVDRMYSTAGIASGVVYGTSTPLHIFGPLTQFVTVTNCHWQNSNGSSLEVGGLGMIDVVGNTVDGGGGFNIALSNLGYFNDWDQVGIGLQVSRNRFNNMINDPGSKIPGVYIGSRTDGGFQYQDVQVSNNTFDSVYACISVRGCQDVVIANNQGSRLYTSTSPASSEGIGILVDGCVGVTLADNRMDMSVVPNSGTSTNRALYGMIVQDSEDVQVHDNQCIDGKQNNFRLTVQDVYQLNFTGGGTVLRDTLFNLDWFGATYTVTGQSSGATLVLVGRVITSGSWTSNTAVGYIFGITSTGTFTNGESLKLNSTSNCAVATGAASFVSLMNRMSFHDNQSRTITTTVAPYFIQPFNANTMISQNNRWKNVTDGILSDPQASLDNGDNSVTLTAYSYPIQRFATTFTANHTVTLPSSGTSYPGLSFWIVRTGTGPYVLNINSGMVYLPPSVASSVRVYYDQGWTYSDFCVLGVQAPSLSADIGDSSVTLTVGQSAQSCLYNTTLTSNRQVVLAGTGAFNGAVFQVVRMAATPGAFTLNVVDGVSSGVLFTFASNTRGDATFQFNGANWILTHPVT